MKLSEAIRLGSMLGPQVYGAMFDGYGGSCVQGSAAAAVGLSGLQMIPQDLAPIWPTLNALRGVMCPNCTTRFNWMFGSFQLLAHLNDRHKLTREQIATFVETIENGLTPAETDSPVLVRSRSAGNKNAEDEISEEVIAEREALDREELRFAPDFRDAR